MPKASKYKDYTAYYVEIIPKKPARYDTFFTPSNKQVGKKNQQNERIRKIDGFSFYDKVTGVEGALPSAEIVGARRGVVKKLRVLLCKKAST